MSHKLLRTVVLIFVLSLAAAPTGSRGARNPRVQDRPLTSPLARPLEIRTAPSAPSLWVRNYGRFFDATNDEFDWLSDAQPAWDGGLVLAGTVSHVYENVIHDALVMDVGPSGDVHWEILYEADPHKDSFNYAEALTRTRDGGYLVVGSRGEYGSLASGVLVMKVGPLPEPAEGGQNSPYRGSLNFGLEWVKSFHFTKLGNESSTAYDVVETQDGGLVLMGSWDLLAPAGGSYWLMKLDPDGHVLWHEDIGFCTASIIPTSDAGILAAGDVNDGVQVVKFDSEGRLQWAQTYREMDPGWGCDDYTFYFSGLSSTSDSGAIMAGTTTGCECCHNEGLAHGWVCKLDRDGRIVWSQGYDITGIGRVLQTTDGGYLMPHWGELIKTDSTGLVEWVKSYAGLEPALAFQAQDGGYMIAGSAEARLMVMRVDSGCHLDPTCSMESIGAATTRGARIISIAASFSTPTENSVRVDVLQNTPFARTLEIRQLCPWGQGSPAPPSRKSARRE